ncbi:MAG: MlaD family protein [Prochlorococcaceae cyanobacterium]|jgi:ABC-type transporter Mla subunit MlaD
MSSAPAPERAPVPASGPDRSRGRLGWLFLIGALLLGGWVVRGVVLEQLRWRGSFEVRLRTRDATGIWPGVHVTLSGYRIGRVDRVRLGPDGVVAVDLRIVSRYRPLLGPRSRAFGTRPGVIGDSEIALTPDPLPAGAPPPRTDLLLPYTPATDVADLLEEIAETRLQIDRTLQGTLKVVEKDLPGAIGRFNGTLDEVSRLAGALERETAPTAAATRDTLAAVKRSGTAVEQVSRRGDQVLQENSPLVQGTLREIRRFTAGTNRLLQMFGSSLLLAPQASPPEPEATEPQGDAWQDRPQPQQPQP